MGRQVPRGAIFYRAVRRRHEVTLDEELRRQTEAIVEAIREMLAIQRLPGPVNDARCENCSLIDACLPAVVGEPARLRGLEGALFLPYGAEEASRDDA